LSQPDCLFCKLVANGDHVHAADGFVVIRDIAPAAETHLLVLPERHVDTFRQIDEFPDEEAGRMLRFVAAVAAAACALPAMRAGRTDPIRVLRSD